MQAGGTRPRGAGPRGADRPGTFAGAFMTHLALGFSAVALGIATRMAQAYKDRTAGRTRADTGVKVVDNALSLTRLAESVHQVDAAAAFLPRDWEQITRCTADGEFPAQDEVVSWRCNQAYAIEMCVEAVDRLQAAAPGTRAASRNRCGATPR